MTDALQTGALRIPLIYFRRAKRSLQPLSSVIPNTTVQAIRNPREHYLLDVLKAIARENNLTFDELLDKFRYIQGDKENMSVTLYGAQDNGFSGYVTVNYYY